MILLILELKFLSVPSEILWNCLKLNSTENSSKSYYLATLRVSIFFNDLCLTSITLPKGSRFINKSGASPTGDLNFFGRRHGLGNPNLHLMLVCQSILNFFRAFLDIYFRFTSCLRVVKMLKMVVKILIFDLI